jgi:sugar (pentulose or hexulose) kinase
LPYLNGERAPFLATNAFGVLLGVTSTTTRGAIGRAVVEGVTMSLKHGMSVVASEANLAGQGSITLAGGGSMSANWAQLVSNLAAKPVVVDGRPDLGALGVASLLLPKTADLSTSSLAQVSRFEPDQHPSEWQAKYSRFLEYVDLFRLKWLKDSNDVSPAPKR